jgi:hypothetical protein
MNINDLYPSKYVKADDLAGQRIRVRIMSVTVEEIADKEHKPVMRFIGKDKGMVLNKTNAMACAGMWGDDTISWQGQDAELMASPVMYQGKQVMGLQLLPMQPVGPAVQPQGHPPAQGGADWGQPQQAPDNNPADQPGPHTAPGATIVPPLQRQPGPTDETGRPVTAPAAQAIADLARDIEQEHLAKATTLADIAAEDIPF